MRHQLHHDDTTTLLETGQPPCLSLYLPTHRHHPENRQDPIRFRNPVKSLDASLRQSCSPDVIDPLLEPFQTLAGDHDFWTTTFHGLAVFGATGSFRVFRLQRTVAELAVAADSFHTTPLRRILQSADRYQGLGHDDLAEVAAAALAGRVATLLIEADRVVPGRSDTATGEVVVDDLANPTVDDVLDDLGELVARRGGEVVMVPGPEMPATTGLAAINRH